MDNFSLAQQFSKWIVLTDVDFLITLHSYLSDTYVIKTTELYGFRGNSNGLFKSFYQPKSC